jgi:branched-subunit amino acid aminotransferase/4-amino-4-deoxychorismate lyase
MLVASRMARTRAGCICVNGRLYPPERASVSALDAGFLLGDGLFESLRATGGVPYLLERHLRRLCAAAAELEFAGMPSLEALAAQVLRTVRRAALGDAYVRVTVTRGIGSQGLASPAGPPTVVIAVLPAPPPAPPGRGLATELLWRGVRRGRPGGPHPRLASPSRRAAAKSTSWQAAVLDRRRVEARGADEGLYVSSSDRVLEGVSSNVFVIAGGRLLTPPAAACLPGITRARVLELARAQGVPVLEAPLPLDALMQAEEVFVTNAVHGPRVVASVAGTAVGRRSAKGLFQMLRRLYELDRTGAREPVG